METHTLIQTLSTRRKSDFPGPSSLSAATSVALPPVPQAEKQATAEQLASNRTPVCQILQLRGGNVIHLWRLSHAMSSCCTRAGWKRIHRRGRIPTPRHPPLSSPPHPSLPPSAFPSLLCPSAFPAELASRQFPSSYVDVSPSNTHYKATIKLLSRLRVLLIFRAVVDFLLQEPHIWLKRVWVILKAGVPGEHLGVSCDWLSVSPLPTHPIPSPRIFICFAETCLFSCQNHFECFGGCS